MQEVSTEPSKASDQRRMPERPVARSVARPVTNATHEAAMLDAPRGSHPDRGLAHATAQQPPQTSSRAHSPSDPASRPRPPQPRLTPQPQAQQDKRPASKLSRSDIEDQTAQAYVSPARRKRPTPVHETQPAPEVDLFSPAPVQVAKLATLHTRSAEQPPTSRPPSESARPAVRPRSRHRKAGGEAYKRGDYAAAHDAYTAALTPLPSTHPIIIVVLSNRALTALKTGDPKAAVSDADRALEIIGASQGVGESIDLGAGEGRKDMREFFGKALTRKAEALEHMEKWSDAAAAWRQAIGAGVGGAVSLRGRDRCEKAAAPAPRPAAPSAATPSRAAASAPRKLPIAKSLGDSLQRPTLSSIVSAEAVKKLRAANAAAEKADDEKFALTDQVDARLLAMAWREGG
ncbi:auxilin-like clathrin-binding protein required for normal clathrin function [Teratosphaeriaceae sp. CCFEE 6253]|nr:auxilin-like clathrin-binding protein required for normal clathrin function [Teratosphaeriaceae sp. CCFEE 6253]